MTAGSAVQLTLVNLTGRRDATWVSQLKKTGDMWASRSMDRLDELQVALEEDAVGYAILVYRNPVDHIAEQLGQGKVPAEALVEWQAWAQSLLSLTSEFWDRTVAMEMPSSSEELSGLAGYLRTTLGVVLSSTGEVELPVRDDYCSDEEYGLQLAAHQLLGLRRPQELLDQLEALSLPIRERPFIPDLVSKFLVTRNSLIEKGSANKELRLKTRELGDELRRVSDENRMVIEELHKAQEELERYVLQHRELNEKLSSMRRGRDYRKAKIAELEKVIRKRDEKVKWLRSVRDQHRATARELRATGSGQTERIRELEQRIHGLRSELRGIKNSRTWRYSRVLRRLNGTAG